MTNQALEIIITKMHIRLNYLIELHNFDLQNKEVLAYSCKLDRVLTLYGRHLKNKAAANYKSSVSNK